MMRSGIEPNISRNGRSPNGPRTYQDVSIERKLQHAGACFDFTPIFERERHVAFKTGNSEALLKIVEIPKRIVIDRNTPMNVLGAELPDNGSARVDNQVAGN